MIQEDTGGIFAKTKSAKCYDGPLHADMNWYLNKDGNWQATDKFTKVTLFDAEWAAGNF